MPDLISREEVRDLLLMYSPADIADLRDLTEEEQACMFMLGDILSDLEDIESATCPNCGYRLNGDVPD